MLASGAALLLASGWSRTPPAAAEIGLVVAPRDTWAGALGPTGPLRAEPDVRFLLVHHTASANTYARADVPALIQSFYRLHTGPEREWPDVAYNFFVDRFGGAWEGRAGSLAGPVQADATGGSQGFAQLCCFIGNHVSEPPTAAAVETMCRLLAMLADRYGIDTTPGATVRFVSRGSNRWPAGRTVTARTIAGHRDMSQTACPGDAAYAMLDQDVPARVQALRASTARNPSRASSTVPTATTGTTAATATSAPTAGTASTIAAPPMSRERPSVAAPSSSSSGADRALEVGAALALPAAALGVIVALRRRASS